MFFGETHVLNLASGDLLYALMDFRLLHSLANLSSKYFESSVEPALFGMNISRGTGDALCWLSIRLSQAELSAVDIGLLND